jgi:predicted short-subunit dehydrogenase-like oxidoreductase (DUF2520 family)
LATHLGLALFRQGLTVLQVYNRTPGKGRKLAARINALYTDNLSDLVPGADLYILAVSDSWLGQLVSRLHLKDSLVVHTSGSVELEILSPVSSRTGVFYPVQTFSKHRKINFRDIPICLEAESPESEMKLTKLAERLTRSVYLLDSGKRGLIHLGAVFASNFTNYLYSIAELLLRENDLPLNILEPLILQTARNVRRGNLFENQTGPAVRGDIQVLEKHRRLLADHPDYHEIYELISKHIILNRSLNGKL